MSNVKMSMATGDMLNMLGNAMLFVSKDSTVPLLSNVLISPQGERVQAIATDRFRVARVDMPLIGFESDHEGELPQLLLPSKLADMFAKALKGLKRDLQKANEWPVSSRGDIPGGKLAHLNVSITNGNQVWELKFPGGLLKGVTEYGGQFPRVESLFFDADPNDSHGIFALSPELLAAFTKVKDLVPSGDKNLPIRFGAGKAGKPISLQYSDWFEGLQMPVRLPEHVAHSSRAA